MPHKVDGGTVIERAAAYAVRMKAHAIILESRKVRNIPESAQRPLRGRYFCGFYATDLFSVGQGLPLDATSLLDVFTAVLAGRASQLRHILSNTH